MDEETSRSGEHAPQGTPVMWPDRSINSVFVVFQAGLIVGPCLWTCSSAATRKPAADPGGPSQQLKDPPVPHTHGYKHLDQSPELSSKGCLGPWLLVLA